MSKLYILFEAASGYALLDVKEMDELGQSAETVQVWPMRRFS
jgi:NOP5NT (NUC127) domain